MQGKSSGQTTNDESFSPAGGNPVDSFPQPTLTSRDRPMEKLLQGVWRVGRTCGYGSRSDERSVGLGWDPFCSLESKKSTSDETATCWTDTCNILTIYPLFFYCLNYRPIFNILLPQFYHGSLILALDWSTVGSRLSPYYSCKPQTATASAFRNSPTQPSTWSSLEQLSTAISTVLRSIYRDLSSQHHIMDCQLQSTDVSSDDVGMDFGWHTDVYSKTIGGSWSAMNTPLTGLQCMSSGIDFKPK